MTPWLIALDLLLTLVLTLRLTRLVVTDDLGKWWLKDPLDNWFHKAPATARRWRWHRYLGGLECPFCVGFWIGAVVLLSLWLVGGPGHAHVIWRWVAAAFTLNHVAAHLGSRLGDAGYADEE